MNLLSILSEVAPLVAYSFSSRGFPDVLERVRQGLPSVSSAYLLSLFDFWYIDELRKDITSNDERIRIWDSGGYETRFSDDVSSIVSAVPSSLSWGVQNYTDAAKLIPWNGNDVLVSFDFDDGSQRSVVQQLEIAFSCYEQIEGDYLRDVLLHVPQNYDVDKLASEVEAFLPRIDIIGFTEKEIAPTWKQGVRFIRALILAFKRRNLHCPLIHLFGCLDPKSLIYFTFAGVKIFDGLSWLRYFFHDRKTLYKREFEFLNDLQGIPRDLDIDLAITRHNIMEIEALRSDLIYYLATADESLFGIERQIFHSALAKES